MDNILDPRVYSLILNSDSEVELVKHVHDYNYLYAQTLDNLGDRNDQLQYYCSRHSDPACKYEKSEDGTHDGHICATIALEGDDGSHTVKYNGQPHGAVIGDDWYEMVSACGSKATIEYYKKSVNASGETTYTSIGTNPPVEPGTYYASAKINTITSISYDTSTGAFKSESRVDKTIETCDFTIQGSPIKLRVTGKERPFRTNSIAEPVDYVDNTVTEFIDHDLIGVAEDDEVKADISHLVAYLSFYNTKTKQWEEKGGYVGENQITGLDVNSVVLTGKDAASYTVTEIEGTCTITQTNQTLEKVNNISCPTHKKGEPYYIPDYYVGLVVGTSYSNFLCKEASGSYIDPNTYTYYTGDFDFGSNKDYITCEYNPLDVNGDGTPEYLGGKISGPSVEA